MSDIIDRIFDIWQRQSHLDYGESVTTFEQLDHWQDALRLRRYDDMGKIPGMATPELEHYRPHMLAGLRSI